MVPYKIKVPGSKQVIEMIPIPSGIYLMGGEDEGKKDRAAETPQVLIYTQPFWMCKTEITWGQYKPYMHLEKVFKKFQTEKIRVVTRENEIDAVTTPSLLYDPAYILGDGKHDDTPAIAMTQYAARQYSKWLSLSTGQYYRLPMESEWEYACRGGTDTDFHFGDDKSKLKEYGWFEDNSDMERHRVAKKKPNPYGLYDMHGNAAEWVLDQYDPRWYQKLQKKVKVEMTLTVEQAFNRPKTEFPGVARGGNYLLDANNARSCFRLKSTKDWKDEDPNFPQSPWWCTTEPALGVGFRLIRPLNPPKDRKGKEQYWEMAQEKTTKVAQDRIRDEGRGAIGIVDPKLAELIKKHLRSDKKK